MLHFTSKCFDHQIGGFFRALVLTTVSIPEPSNAFLCYNLHAENGQRKITYNTAISVLEMSHILRHHLFFPCA